MKVKGHLSNEVLEIKSIEDAILALLNIGNANDGAVIVKWPGRSSMLVYEGLAHMEPSRFDRPDTRQGFEEFLYELFDPFLYKEDNSRQSLIRVQQFPAVPQRCGYALGITILLYLKQEFVDAAAARLKLCADSAEKADATIFYLD